AAASKPYEARGSAWRSVRSVGCTIAGLPTQYAGPSTGPSPSTTACQGNASCEADGRSSKCSPVHGSAETFFIIDATPPTSRRPMMQSSAAPPMSTMHETTSVMATALSPPDVVKMATSTDVSPTENQNDQPSSPSNIAAALTKMVATVPTMNNDQITAKNVRTPLL